MRAIIDMIVGMHAYTKCGDRVDVTEITGNPRNNSQIENDGTGWKVIGNSNDSDCVNGVCPVK